MGDIYRTCKQLVRLSLFLSILLIFSITLNIFQTVTLVKMSDRFLEETGNRLEKLENTINEFMTKFDVLFVETTAYAPYDSRGLCNDGDVKTSTGVYPSSYTVAVDPKIFPYGTRFLIPGHGLKIAQDTGVAMRKRTLEVSRGQSSFYLVDMAVKTHQEAVKYGRKIVPVFMWRDAVVHKS